ncbi:ADP-ribosylglycohydrolase family protein [Okibacterium endophyticum]
MTTTTTGSRALAALRGLALGDALGMPTQSMSPEQIAADYGVIDRFIAAGPNQRIAVGMPAARITDDTEQAVLLGELLVESGGSIDPGVFADRLLAWEQRMIDAGSLDLLGPSTKAALSRLHNGVPPEEAGRFGATNGAAMRIAPVGIATPAEPLHAFVDAVARASQITHNTSIGLAAAAAVGAAVSAGVAGAGMDDALETAVAAADLAERRGHWVAGGRIGPRIRWAAALLRDAPVAERASLVTDVIGTSVQAQESVVAALALASVSSSPWQTLCDAAAYGGDSDTVAAMAGAVLGAVHGPDAWPADATAAVERLNGLELDALATGLLDLRAGLRPHSEGP